MQPTEKNDMDLQHITGTVQNYFNGMHYGDVSSLEKALHPDAFLFGYLRGNRTRLAAEEWFALVKSRPVPAQNGEPYDMRIVSIDITGEVAAVKAAVLYQGLRFTDYLTLLKIDGKWLIVNKAFQHETES